MWELININLAFSFLQFGSNDIDIGTDMAYFGETLLFSFFHASKGNTVQKSLSFSELYIAD